MKAVLWDMDGTLVDTEPHWIAAEHRLVEEHGGSWTEEQAHSLVGNPLLVSAQVLQDAGVHLPLEEIIERLMDDVAAAMRTEMPWRPGVRALLDELADAGIPCGLVTMSYARLVEPMLEALPGVFQAVVTGDVVEQGKPHPEPYLTAAALIGVDPGECVALEDSPTGLASAEAAGCIAVGIPHVVPIDPREGRRLVPSLDIDLATLRRLTAPDEG